MKPVFAACMQWAVQSFPKPRAAVAGQPMKERNQQVVPQPSLKQLHKSKYFCIKKPFLCPPLPLWPSQDPSTSALGIWLPFPAVLADHLTQITLSLTHSTFWRRSLWIEGVWADLDSSPVSTTWQLTHGTRGSDLSLPSCTMGIMLLPPWGDSSAYRKVPGEGGMGVFPGHGEDCRNVRSPYYGEGTQCPPIEIKLTEGGREKIWRGTMCIFPNLSFNYTNNTQMHAPLSI